MTTRCRCYINLTAAFQGTGKLKGYKPCPIHKLDDLPDETMAEALADARFDIEYHNRLLDRKPSEKG